MVEKGNDFDAELHAYFGRNRKPEQLSLDEIFEDVLFYIKERGCPPHILVHFFKDHMYSEEIKEYIFSLKLPPTPSAVADSNEHPVVRQKNTERIAFLRRIHARYSTNPMSNEFGDPNNPDRDVLN